MVVVGDLDTQLYEEDGVGKTVDEQAIFVVGKFSITTVDARWSPVAGPFSLDVVVAV